MELALNTGAFEALDNSELFAVDGGGWFSTCLIIGGVVMMVAGAITLTPALIVGGAVMCGAGAYARYKGY